jgi:hypothetical protein
MVWLCTFSTPHAHTYGYNLGFLRAIGFPFGGGDERGVVQKRGKFVGSCILVTVANIQRTHLKVSTRGVTLPSAFLVLGST